LTEFANRVHLERQSRIRVIRFPKYTPEENPKERMCQMLNDEVSHHYYHPTKTESVAGNRWVLPEGLATYGQIPEAVRLLLGERNDSSATTTGLTRISGILVYRSSRWCCY
jgi:hypothetical protein